MKRYLFKIVNYVLDKTPERIRRSIFEFGKSIYDQRINRTDIERGFENKEIEININNIKIKGNPKISIIIPTKNKVEYLKRCI